MVNVNLLDIYNGINNCPRRIMVLQMLCYLAEKRRDGEGQVEVNQLAEETDNNIRNIQTSLTPMAKQGFIARVYLDEAGEEIEQYSPKGKVVIRLSDECASALGVSNETVLH